MRVRFPIAGLIIITVFASNVSAGKKTMRNPFSFAVLGHVRSYENGRVNSLLGELLGEVRKLGPDMVFLTGDMIWGEATKALADSQVIERDWNRLDAMLDKLGVPIHRVPGNHDINDPRTRDIYYMRYGRLPRAISYQGSLFILLNSAYVPTGNRETRKYILTARLESNQVDFIRATLSQEKKYDHVFLFTHHVLWWRDDAPWWRDVHPLLIKTNVRAVFSGDLGPMKFSHMRRDGIDYLQSAIEDDFSLEHGASLKMLHGSEEDRLLAQQFDNYLYVTVDGPHVVIDVNNIGAMSSGKFSPQRWRQVNGPEIVQEEYVYDSQRSLLTSWAIRIRAIIRTPFHFLGLALVMGVAFLVGVLATVSWSRRKSV